MSDESWYCMPSLQGKKIGYTEKDWALWREEISKRKEGLGWEGTLSEFEKACWAYTQSKDGSSGTGVASDKGEVTTASSPTAKRKANDKASEPDSKKVRSTSKKVTAESRSSVTSDTGRTRTRSRSKANAAK